MSAHSIVMAAVCGLIATGCAPAPRASEAPADVLAQGHEIAETQCSACHAVGPTGRSPRADAPVFRHILAQYGAEPLSDALIEGVKIGHPDMPLFKFDPKGVDSLVAYLRSIQTPQGNDPPPARPQ